MGHWKGGGMWVWAAFGTLVVVLLVVVIRKLPRK
jgi:heme exporter protein D